MLYPTEVLVAILPQVKRTVNGWSEKALGCSSTLVTKDMVDAWSGASSIKVVDERELQCNSTNDIKLTICGMQLTTQAIIHNEIVAGVNVVLDRDVIHRLGKKCCSKWEWERVWKTMSNYKCVYSKEKQCGSN